MVLLARGIRYCLGLVMGMLVLVSPAQGGQSLAAMLTAVVNDHPDLAINKAAVAAAQGQYESANWQYYPSLSMSVESAHSEDDPQLLGDDTVARLTLQQNLWPWDGVDAEVNMAATRLHMARTRLQEQQWQLAEHTIISYGHWLSSYLAVQAWLQAMEDHQAMEAYIDEAIKQGLLASVEGDIMAARMASARVKFSGKLDGEELARRQFNHVTSVSWHQDDLANLRSAPIKAGLTGPSAEALLLNPKIKLAEAEVQAARYELQRHEALLQPHAYLRVEHLVNDHVQVNSGARTRWFVGVSGATGAGLSLWSQLRTEQAELREKQARLISAKRELQESIQSLQFNRLSLERNLATLMQALEASEKVMRSHQRLFFVGRKPWQEIMGLMTEVVQLKTQIADTQGAYLVASWRLILMLHGMEMLAKQPH